MLFLLQFLQKNCKFEANKQQQSVQGSKRKQRF